jgi:hypothetical protein
MLQIEARGVIFCEERSDEAIHWRLRVLWIASLRSQ